MPIPAARTTIATRTRPAPIPRGTLWRWSQATSGEATEAIIAAVISGITIVSVRARSQIAPIRAAAPPTRSHAEKPRSRSHCGAAKIPLSSAGSTSIASSSRGLFRTRRMSDSDLLTYVGHATVVIELDGTRLLTDPVLRRRIGPLVRHGAMPSKGVVENIDAVLISHMHRDHADPASLRMLRPEVRMLVPPGSRRFFERHGFADVTERRPGESTTVGALAVTAVQADHDAGGRRHAVDADSLGFLIVGQRSVYFAGDTDLFEGMAELAPDLALALLPIWGWGPTLGPGHLDPERAAE